VAFGIPGSLGTAILLGALVIQGLRPGPEMLTDNLDITFSMIWDIVIANILACAVLMVLSKQVAKVAFIPGHLLVPGVAIFVLMGAWLATASMGDWWVCLGFGALGYIMKQGDWPRPPLILALVLGALMEDNLLLSLQVYEGYTWIYDRPIVLIIIALIVATLATSGLGLLKFRIKGSEKPAVVKLLDSNPIFSWPFNLAVLGLFVWSLIEAQQWDYDSRQFPEVVATTGILTSGLALLFGARELLARIRDTGTLTGEVSRAAGVSGFRRSMCFFGYLLGAVALTFLFGQVIALPVFVAIYLARWGGYNWKVCLGYAACGWVLMYVLYDRIMGIFFQPPLLFG
jgi:hypothetical protein